MYFVEKEGVYSHGVFWIGDDLDEGIAAAEKLAAQDIDSYHTWCVREYVDHTDATGDESDAERHILKYEVEKGKEGTRHA